MDALIHAIVSRGARNLLIPEKAIKIAMMLKDVPDDALKEISILINKAEYCSIVGIPFKSGNYIQGIKKASGRRA